jgi:catechol 2,3-dioxygenase-like lactoylglutathione lyase family enzyme
MALNHVALTVADRERSAAFYARHFGISERIHDDEHLLIIASADGSLLALSHGSVPTGLPRTNHFGFEVGDVGEVRHARDALRAAGVEELEWQDEGGLTRVQIADPDGYRVDLYAYESTPAPRPPRSRWTSFVADPANDRPRTLSEQGNPDHRLRVEHNRDTLLVHLSDEDGDGWTVLAVDRATRSWAVGQSRRQLDAAQQAFEGLYD